MRTLVPAVVLALVIANLSRAQEAAAPAPANPAPEPAAYVATGGIGSVADMKAFADEFWNARFDLTKAAKVDKLVFAKDAGRFTLTGWIFAKAPVRGITSRVHFFAVASDTAIAGPMQNVANWISQARCNVHNTANVCGKVWPQASRPWLRRITACLLPMLASSRGASSEWMVMPSKSW